MRRLIPSTRRAFVLSLTEWEGRAFSGGETVLFKPHMLDFWSTFDPTRGFEMKDMVRMYQPLAYF